MLQEFAQSVEDTAKEAVNEIHTALPGKIVAFDTGTGMATVQSIGKFKTSDGKSLDYPAISKVPVVFPHSHVGNCGIVFPVLPGDSCLLVISEVELDEWRTGATAEGALKFDLTNAICIPGMLHNANKAHLGAYNSSGILLYSGGTKVAITGSGVAITGTLTVSGDVIGAGTSLKGHKHTSGEAGSSTSGPN